MSSVVPLAPVISAEAVKEKLTGERQLGVSFALRTLQLLLVPAPDSSLQPGTDCPPCIPD